MKWLRYVAGMRVGRGAKSRSPLFYIMDQNLFVQVNSSFELQTTDDALTIIINSVISFHTKMYLFWNGRIEPLLSNVDIWDQTAMVGGVSQEDA